MCKDKTREQLVKELAGLRRRMAELEALEGKRRQAEEALAKERNLLRTLIDHLPEHIYVKDTESRFLVANQTVAHVMGVDAPEALLGKTDFDFHPPELAEQYYADEQAILASGRPMLNREEPFLDRATGQMRWLLTSKIPFRDSQGNIVGLVGLNLDVTERKQAQEALRQYNLELQARNDELDAFAHTVAHDLKSPLAAIVGYSETLEDNYDAIPAEEHQHYLHRISQSGQKMGNIIDELLLLAGVRQMEVTPVPLDMAEIVAEALERLSYLIEECRAEILVPDRWPTARGYTPWIEEVWVNYLSNAISYGGQPPRVEIGAAAEKDGTARFWVRDNGLGLTPAEQTRLFQPFERLDQTRAKGHGLGLSIVRRIMEKLGGEVGVESKLGRGSEFSFTLPGAEPNP